MSDPVPYSRTYSFTDFQAGNPSAPLPGIQVDNELENVEQSLSEAIDAIKDVRRSDGKLKNGIVTIDSLDPTVAAGVGAGALASAEAAANSADAAASSAVAAAASAGSAAGYAGTAATSAGQAMTARNAALNAVDDATAMAVAAAGYRDFASQWASAPAGVDVDDGVNPVGKSSYHWAQVALGAATGALPDGSVSETKIVDEAVTGPKLSNALRVAVLAYFPETLDLFADNNDTIGYSGAGAFATVAGDDVVKAGGYRYAVAASDAADHHVETAGGVKLYVLPRDGVFDLDQWDVSTGAADNAAAIQSAMEVAADAGLSLHLGSKGTTWPCTGSVAPDVAGKRLTLTGRAKLLFSGSGYLEIAGTITDTTYVATAVAKGSRTLAVNSAAGLAVGDVLAIEDTRNWSFSAAQYTGREAYHAGDFARIAAISGNTLTFDEPLRDSFPALTTSKVFKIDPVELHTGAFEVEASGTPTSAVDVRCVVGGTLNFHSKGGAQRATIVSHLWKTNGHGARHIHTAADVGTNYGFVPANCQDCNFIGFYAYGTRRGIATGTRGGNAGVPMRNVWFIGGSSDNADDNLGSADLHGDADNCGFIGHRASFFDIGGRSPKVLGCTTSPRGSANPVYFTELAGGDIEVRDLKVMRGPTSTFTSIVSGRNGGQLAQIKENYTIAVKGGSIDDGTGLISVLNFYHAAAAPVRASAFVDAFKVLGGTVASNFRVLSSTVANPAGHTSVLAPEQLKVGEDCVWAKLTPHFWIVFSGTHTGCRVWAPSTTFLTSFSILAANSTSTAQNFSFVGYPFAPTVECIPFGLTSAAGQLIRGSTDAATATTATVNVVTGKSSDTAGADRTLSARVQVSMQGAIAA